MLLLQLVADGIVSGCAVGLVAISFAYVYTTTGVFHVAHAGVYTLSGYVAWYLSGLGVPFALALVGAILASAAVGALIQWQLYERLARADASPLVMLIASLGTLAILQNIVAIAFTPNILQFDLPWRLDLVFLGPVALSVPQLAIVVMSVVVVAALLAFSRYTPLGKRIRAVASNPQLAEITRLKPQVVFIYVMAISSGIVAVPGVMTGLDQALQPYTSILILLMAVVAMIAGGIGSIAGAFVMSIALVIIQNASLAVIPGRWSIAIVFGIFILFILLKPEGLFRKRFSRSI
jgi:branched-chain amino acid transport system permease protein